MAPRHCMRDHGARGHPVFEEIALLQRLPRGLIEHVPPTGGAREEQKEKERYGLHSSTSRMQSGFRFSRNLAVPSRWNFGSCASMQRKNRSIEARLNSGTLNTG